MGGNVESIKEVLSTAGIEMPITENWDGESDTKLVTDGKVEILDKGECPIKPNINKEEAHKFALALNQFISA